MWEAASAGWPGPLAWLLASDRHCHGMGFSRVYETVLKEGLWEGGCVCGGGGGGYHLAMAAGRPTPAATATGLGWLWPMAFTHVILHCRCGWRLCAGLCRFLETHLISLALGIRFLTGLPLARASPLLPALLVLSIKAWGHYSPTLYSHSQQCLYACTCLSIFGTAANLLHPVRVFNHLVVRVRSAAVT